MRMSSVTVSSFLERIKFTKAYSQGIYTSIIRAFLVAACRQSGQGLMNAFDLVPAS